MERDLPFSAEDTALSHEELAEVRGSSGVCFSG